MVVKYNWVKFRKILCYVKNVVYKMGVLL